MITSEYLSGFFDGEGCISIVRAQGVRKSHFTIQVTLVNTHLPTLQKIQEVFGGRLYSYKQSNRNWRDKHSLVWAGTNKAKELLEKILPFSITKREQIEFILNEWIPQTAHPHKTLVSVEEIAQREFLTKRLSAMKRIEYSTLN